MSYDDDHLDEEIDRELGWDSGRVARLRRAAKDPFYMRLLRSWPMRALRAIFRVIFKVVFFPIFSPSGYSKRFDIDGNVTKVRRSFLWRLLDGLVVRVLLTPVIAGLFLLLLVWLTTHPKPVLATETPSARGMFFQRISMISTDGQEIHGWLIPPFNADQVVVEGSAVMNHRYPAVVMAHGLGYSHEQYLNLAQQLHQAGCTVLMVDTRGQGESPAATVTFGVRERLDLAAAVNYVRELSYTDTAKLGMVGYSAGGAAALQVAAADPSIGAVVADAVRSTFADNLAPALENPFVPASWLVNPYEMTFELTVRERLGSLDLAPIVAGIHHSAILLIARPQSPGDGSKEQAALLASNAGGPHQVITCSTGTGQGELVPNDAARVTEFLCQTLHWTAGERSAALEELFKARVK